MSRYESLAWAGPGELVYGRSARPVHCGYDLKISAGTVFPEVNFKPPGDLSAAAFRAYHEPARKDRR